eukprot:Rmarinus@m.7032
MRALLIVFAVFVSLVVAVECSSQDEFYVGTDVVIEVDELPVDRLANQTLMLSVNSRGLKETYTLYLSLSYDYFSYETGWNIWNVGTSMYIWSSNFGNQYTNVQITGMSPGSFEFHIFDSYGDGGCGGTLVIEATNELLASWESTDYEFEGHYPFTLSDSGCPESYECVANKGECIDAVCVCDEGFTGLTCSEGLGDCGVHYECSNNGYCVNNTCSCPLGWGGQYCTDGSGSCLWGDYDCAHNGTCSEVSGLCECTQGYFGLTCDEGDGACPDSFSCVYGDCVNGVCNCAQGITGLTCDVGLGHCEDGPDPTFYSCHNNGTCTDGECVCDVGFGGYDCSEGDGMCGIHFDCLNGGTCDETTGECSCTGAAHGTDCSLGRPGCGFETYDCVHGYCSVSFMCICEPGWAGYDCAVPVDPSISEDNYAFVAIPGLATTLEYFGAVMDFLPEEAHCSDYYCDPGSWCCNLATASAKFHSSDSETFLIFIDNVEETVAWDDENDGYIIVNGRNLTVMGDPRGPRPVVLRSPELFEISNGGSVEMEYVEMTIDTSSSAGFGGGFGGFFGGGGSSETVNGAVAKVSYGTFVLRNCLISGVSTSGTTAGIQAYGSWILIEDTEFRTFTSLAQASTSDGGLGGGGGDFFGGGGGCFFFFCRDGSGINGWGATPTAAPVVAVGEDVGGYNPLPGANTRTLKQAGYKGAIIHAEYNEFVMLRRCTFASSIISGSGTDYAGGIVYVGAGNVVRIQESVFAANTSPDGVVFVEGELEIWDSTFSKNLASAVESYGYLVMSNCSFLENEIQVGEEGLVKISAGVAKLDTILLRENSDNNGPSGIVCEGGSTLEVDDAIFIDNRGCHGPALIANCDAVLRGSQFIGNAVAGEGSALYAPSTYGNSAAITSISRLERCIVTNNTYDETLASGCGGGITDPSAVYSARPVELVGVVFSGNDPSGGLGYDVDIGDVTSGQSTFVSLTFDDHDYNGNQTLQSVRGMNNIGQCSIESDFGSESFCTGVASCEVREYDSLCICPSYYVLSSDLQSCQFGLAPPQRVEASDITTTSLVVEWEDVHGTALAITEYFIEVFYAQQYPESTPVEPFEVYDVITVPFGNVTVDSDIRRFPLSGLSEGGHYRVRISALYTTFADLGYTEPSGNLTVQTRYCYPDVLPATTAMFVDKPAYVTFELYLLNSGSSDCFVEFNPTQSISSLSYVSSSATIAPGKYQQTAVAFDSAGLQPSLEPFVWVLELLANSVFHPTINATVTVVVSAEADSSQSVVVSPDPYGNLTELRAGETLVVHAQARDVDNMILDDGTALFYGQLHNTDGLLSAKSFQYIGSGIYEMSVTPVLVGDYWVHVLLGGGHIEGSPVPLVIVPADADPAASELISSFSLINAGTYVEFGVLVQDMYGNAIPDYSSGVVEAAIRRTDIDSPEILYQPPEELFDSGRYNFYIESRAAGDYELRVSVLGQSLEDRPEFTVLPGSAVAAMTSISSCGDSYTVCESSTAGGHASFSVAVRDRFGNPTVLADSDELEMSCGAECVTELTETVVDGEGTYEFDISMTMAGSHLLTCTLNGEEVENSPVYMSVGPTVVSAEMSSVVACGGGEVNVSTVAHGGQFCLQMRDTYGNNRNAKDSVAVLLSPEVVGNPTIAAKVIWGGDGRYTIQYITATTNAGYFLIEVVVQESSGNAAAVAGTPFRMFSKCPANTYHSDDGSVCLECPVAEDDRTLCPEGVFAWGIIPPRNYWRFSPDDIEFYECLERQPHSFGTQDNTTAYDEDADRCRGIYDINEQDRTCHVCLQLREWDFEDGASGQCAKGYTSNLCAVCEPGYTRTGSAFVCTDCPEPWVNWIITIALGFVVVLFVTYLVVSQLRSALKILKTQNVEDHDDYSIVLKIFMSYLQVVTFARNIDFEWPLELLNFFDMMSVVVEPGQQFTSVDCLLQQMDTSENGFYRKVRILVMVPPLALLGTFLFFHFGYMSLYRLRKFRQLKKQAKKDGKMLEVAHIKEAVMSVKRADLREKIGINTTVTLIVILFFLYPTLSSEVFMLLNCRDLGDRSFLLESMDIECYTEDHIKQLQFVFIPGLVLYVCGIPMLAFYLLYRNRHHLSEPLVAAKYGFLYSGFEVEFFWWECWIMLRKTVVAFITVFMTGFAVTVQGLCLLGFLVVSMTLHVYAQPYNNDFFDNLESLSLASSFLTIYAGLYFYQPELEDHTGLRLFLTVVVILLNLVTSCYFLYVLVRTFKYSDTLKTTKKRASNLVKVVKRRRASSLAREKAKLFETEFGAPVGDPLKGLAAAADGDDSARTGSPTPAPNDAARQPPADAAAQERVLPSTDDVIIVETTRPRTPPAASSPPQWAVVSSKGSPRVSQLRRESPSRTPPLSPRRAPTLKTNFSWKDAKYTPSPSDAQDSASPSTEPPKPHYTAI